MDQHEQERTLLRSSLQGESLQIELAKSYHRQGQFNLAIAELKRAIAINPHNELSHFEMGNVSVKIKDDFQAEKEYKKALDLNRQLDDASVELGKIYRRQGRIDLAMSEFKKVIESSAKNWDALYEVGRIYKEGGNLILAAENLAKASAINSDHQEIHFELGKIYRDLQSPELAIKEFNKVLSIAGNAKDIFIQNKVLNEIEITQKKSVLESKVRAFVAMIVNRCNVKCIMCHIWKTPWQVSAKTIQELISLFPYVEDMVWEGGEVFLMKEFGEILQATKEHPHLKQVIFTNGLLLSEKLIEKIINIQGNVDIVFSIDGVTKDTYERIRKGGDFQRLIDNLVVFNQLKAKFHCNINIYFNSVIMKSNYRELEMFVDFAKNYGFNAMTMTPIRGDFAEENIFENGDSEALSFIQKVSPKIAKKAHEYGIRLHNWIPGAEDGCAGTNAETQVCQEPAADTAVTSAKECKRLICHAPWQRMVIDSEGQVRPFVFCLNKWIGNTDRESLQQIWNGEAMQEYRKEIINQNYKQLCQPECISGQVADKIRDII